MTDWSSRAWTNHAGGYNVCTHMGCSKKADWQISDHDCCGRCSQGRAHLQAALRNYAGLGTFPHRFDRVFTRTGRCGACGEPPEAH